MEVHPEAPKARLLKIVVIGSGAFGTALGLCAARNGHEVVVVSRQPDVVKGINEQRKHPSRLLDAQYTLPSNVRASADAEEALRGADFILHTVPVQYSRQTLQAYDKFIGNTPIISASKGIESESLMYMSQLVPDALKRSQRMAFLSGPVACVFVCVFCAQFLRSPSPRSCARTCQLQLWQLQRQVCAQGPTELLSPQTGPGDVHSGAADIPDVSFSFRGLHCEG